ncbi:MAG: hypothetical protein AAFW87_13700 [Pseudomonadota bacterium]
MFFRRVYFSSMQLVLDLDDRTRVLAQIHHRLKSHFGCPIDHQQLDPVSQLVMSLIGGKTRGAVSLAAYMRLWTRFRSWEAVRDGPVALIEECIAGVTFADVKAPRLKTALQMITHEQGALTLAVLEPMSVYEAHQWLERLPGVGRKVAAATLNFSTLRKRTLVVDTHHLRVLIRLKFIADRATIARAYDHVMPLLPSMWQAGDLDKHHSLMKRLGQTICLHGAPFCPDCPLRTRCPAGLNEPTNPGRQS